MSRAPLPRADALGGTTSVSSQRTYRYVRVSLVAAVLMLGVGVVWSLSVVGTLRSISAAYYTPARTVFVGALFAVGVALVVLAGRSVRRFLLLLAGMTAPVIALVPTPLPSEELENLVGIGCPVGLSRCLPTEATEGVAVGMLAYLMVATAVLLASIVFLALDRALDGWAIVRVGIAAALLLALTVWSMLPSFVQLAHYGAAALFFLLIAMTAGLHAFSVQEEGASGPGSARFYSRCYAVLAILIAVVDLAVAALLVTGRGEHWLLLGETVALALFGVFWVLQTVENWDTPNATFSS